MILYPVPVELMGKVLLLEEHFKIMEVHEEIVSGTFTSDDARRWSNFIPALYDRYRLGLERLTSHYECDLTDWFHMPLAYGANVVYPEIPQIEADDFFLTVISQGVGLDI